MTRRFVISIALTLAAVALALLPTHARADCDTIFTDQFGNAPHQGAGKSPVVPNTLYGVSANISYSNPFLGCPDNGFSFTSEWVMVVAPGDREWLQFGWRRLWNYPAVHLWYEYSHGSTFVDVEIPYEPLTTHEYKLMAVPDPQTGVMSWWVVDNGLVRVQLSATTMGWSQPSSGAELAQWSGEVTNLESEMGGLVPTHVTFDNLHYQESNPTNGWQPAQPSIIYNSFTPKYGGDPVNVANFSGTVQNWTHKQIFMPIIQTDIHLDE